MPHSFADQLMLTCPQCGTFFTPDVWLIIDTAERPDLPALIRDGSIHRFICPNGHPGEVDAPLLLFRPDQNPPLLFAPAARTTAEQDRTMADGLLGRLAESLGDAWRAEWLPGMLTLPRRLLAEALDSDDAAATLDRVLADAIPPDVGDALGQIMTSLANEGVRLDTPHDLESALAARPELRERLEAAMRGRCAGIARHRTAGDTAAPTGLAAGGTAPVRRSRDVAGLLSLRARSPGVAQRRGRGATGRACRTGGGGGGGSGWPAVCRAFGVAAAGEGSGSRGGVCGEVRN